MPTSKDFSVEDEAYLSAIAAEPKMTMDEVGADIDEHGHVPVTPETATQDPFTAKGSLAYALDEALSADTDLEKTIMTRDKNDHLDSHLTNPTDDFRDETKGEVEGTTSTPQGLIQPVESNKVGEGLEPTIQQDKAVQVKDSLAEALDAITMDGAEEIEAKPPIGKDPEPDLSKYNEEEASHIPLKAPKIPPSLGGAEDTPDANGLVYVSATFTVDPDKYVSNNYRPANMGKAPDALAALKQKRAAMNSKPAANPEEEAALSDLGTPEAKESAASPDEPTPQQEEEAAKDADKEQKEEIEVEVKEEAASAIPTPKKDDKTAQDEAPEKVVLDYATFIDGSSFICYDEVADIDYSKIAMDAGPKKAPTRATCQTTFAQCRAENPLFCRFHGPKLLEADIKTAIKATVGPGCVVQVTKDKNSKNKFTFRLTVGCPPSKKKMVEKMVHMYLTQNPGITSSTEDWNLVGKHKQTQEFEMDILQADKPPKKDTKADQMLSNTKKAIKEHKKQDVVGETAPGLEKKAAKGEKWETVDEDIENEWADLVDKTVHKSLLGNNEEFLANFNKIANQFDQSHDAGDAAGLKQALEALKDEIGKYDENGEKKPEASTVEAEKAVEGVEEEATNGDSNNGNSSELEESLKGIVNDMNALGTEGMFEYLDEDEEFSQAFMDGLELQKQAEEALNELKKGNGEYALVNEKIQAFKKQFEKCKSIKDKKIAQKEKVDSKSAGGKSGDMASFPMAQEAEFAEASKGHKFEELFTGFETNKDGSYTLKANPHKLSSHVGNLAKALQKAGYDAKTILNNSDDLDLVIKPKAEAGGAIKEDGKQDVTVLPAPSAVSKNEETSGDSDGPKHAITEFEKNYGEKPLAQSDGGNAISSLQNELSGLMEKMQSVGATTDADVFAMQHMCNYHMEELNAAKSSLDEIEAKINSVSENSSGDSVADAMSMSVLEEAKKKAQYAVDENIAQVHGSIKQFTESLQSYENATMETAKKGAADSVEQTIKNLGLYIFGNKRPPQGVDSVTDYLDYLKDEFESGAASTLTPDEQSEIEDQYSLEDAYKATKAASKAMDDAIETFKDKMDEVPSQGEDYGTYQADIEQMQKAVESQAVEIMAAFGAYKSALEKCKYEADAAKKLAESKKKLEGGGMPGGEGKKPVDPFDFDAWQKGQTEQGSQESEGATVFTTNEEKKMFSLYDFPISKLGEYVIKGTKHGYPLDMLKEAYLETEKNRQQDLRGDDVIKRHEAIMGAVDLLMAVNGLEDNKGGMIKDPKDDSVQVAFSGSMKENDKKNLLNSVNHYLSNFKYSASIEDGKMKIVRDESINQPEKSDRKVESQGGVKPSSQQAKQKTSLTDEEKKAKIAAMSPKQKLEAAIKIFKKKLAANPNNETAKSKLSKYEAMLAKLEK